MNIKRIVIISLLTILVLSMVYHATLSVDNVEETVVLNEIPAAVNMAGERTVTNSPPFVEDVRPFDEKFSAGLLIDSIAAAPIDTVPAEATAELQATYSGTCGTNVSWSLDTATKTLTISGTGPMAYYNIDSTTGRSKAPWSYYSSYIESVVIENGVTSIGGRSFYDHYHLQNVYIPNSVTSIEDNAFYACDQLRNVTIPNSVVSIGDGAYCYCMFDSVVIGSGVQSFGRGVFANNSQLWNVKISNGVKSIGSSMFSGDIGLESISIPSSVTSIGFSAFENCSRLANISIGSGVKSVEDSAFSGCSSLKSITIPNGVTLIEHRAFYQCSALQSITLPSSLQSVGGQAFMDCSELKTVNYLGTFVEWMNVKGRNVIMALDATLLIQGSSIENIESVVVPEGETSISASMFYNMKGLKSVTIPDSVTSIGNNAFENCINLTNLTLGTEITSIGKEAFKNCSKLTSFTIPGKVSTINESTFYGCRGLSSVVMPTGLKSIGNTAFQNCSSLTSIIIPDGVTSIGAAVFSGCSKLNSITMPFCSSNGFQSQNLGYYFGESSYTGSTEVYQYSSSGNRYFYVPTSLRRVTITKGDIGTAGFKNCSMLSSITLPQSNTIISPRAFQNCSGLISITISGNVTAIHDGAFDGCSGLQQVIYCGTQSQWNAISFGVNNEPVKRAALILHTTHSWSSSTVLTAATCTMEGKMSSSCTV